MSDTGMATARPDQVAEGRDLVVQRAGHVILDHLTFTVPRGQVTGLLGPSGCGKTTLLRTLVGVQRITAGTATLLGLPAGHPKLRARVGYATQAPAVYPDLTLTENLRYFGTVLGLRRRELTAVTARTVADLDLGGLEDRLVATFSGGQLARVGLAVALLAGPDLLVLDEPTVGLDPVLRRDLWQMFHRLADGGAALLVSSHVMDEAARCDYLLFMRDGRFLAEASPPDILAQTGAPDLEGAFLQLAEAPREPVQRAIGGVLRMSAMTARSSLAAETVAPLFTPALTAATARRVLAQLRHDPRTVALMVVVPSVLMILLRYVLNNPLALNRFAPSYIGVFPFVIMFVVTAITTQRERARGTLERLMAMPLGKLDLLAGYGLAFGLIACLQVAIVLVISLTWLGVSVPGSPVPLAVIAVLDAILGMATGLFASAFARSEFQAVQFMPAFVLPQALLCGLIVARADMTPVLRWLSDVLPLSYAVDAMQRIASGPSWTAALTADVAIIAAFTAAALVGGALTLRRSTS
jgi:ABC transporter DrrB family efflux protein